MRTLLVIGLLLVSVFVSVAQTNPPGRTEADAFFQASEYSDALPVYLSLLSSDSSDALLNYKTGICYFNSRSHKSEAITYLERCIRGTETTAQLKERKIPLDVFKTLGDAYHQAYNFDKAIFNYEKYKALLNDNAITDKDILE